ncbi:MAG TPA: M3 family metallopeptidase [Caulobacteraceae bacterium]|jgi:peptidyl-dipeptidase Dcp|nr:M3 family metallopeptidase [Caulobacteraceae bacterium]
MRTLVLAAASASVLALVAALPADAAVPAHKAPAHHAAMPSSSNPLLAPWTGPHGGYPPFDKVKLADFEPAMDAAMAQNKREIEAIADNKAAPTFDNTIVPLEKSGQTLARVNSIYSIWASNLNTPDFQKIQAVIDPKLAAFNDSITQNPKLFARINAIYSSKAKTGLRPDQQRLVWIYWDQFTQAGAKLSPQAKARVTQINQRLASLYGEFQKHLLADESGYVTYLKADQLGGLPQSLKDAAAQAAADHGHKGEWAITNTRSSMDPFLTYSDDRPLREKVWRNYYSRGDNHDANDNSAIVVEIVKLRTEKAKLMGFPTYAHWKLYDKMAKTPDAAMALMLKVWPEATERVREEVADMQTVADREGAKITIAPWDYRYYAEKVRKEKYALDNNEVRQYLQFDKIRDAVFWEAGQLYGFKFVKIEGVPTFAPDMSVYEVLGRDGKRVGLWYLDPYARAGKNSGAWEQPYRPQSFLLNQTTIVSNNTNFVKAPAGQPTLISWEDGITIFHEFGHALHDLNSAVTYPTQAGTNVATDFVEFPSQLNENWLSTPEVLNKFAVSADGKPIPPELVAKIRKASTFNQGFDVTEYLSAAIYDMKAHLAGDSFTDPDGFEKALFTELKMPSEVVMRHRPTQFFHAFEGDGYAAGYYSYLWAEVLDHDAFEAFLENGGPYDKAEAKKYHDDIVSVGNTIDPGQAYRNFRGHDASIDGYLKSKGFPLPKAAQAQGGSEKTGR